MNIRNILIWSLLLCLLTLATDVQSINATAKLIFDKPSYFLGENVLAHYSLTNTGNAPIDLSFGGDYRGAPYEMSYQVTVSDSNGRNIPNLYNNVQNHGGLGGDLKVEPGKTFWHSVPLMDYADITKSGIYTISVYNSFGMNNNKSNSITLTAKGKVKLIMPTAKNAAKVIKQTISSSINYGGTMGEKHYQYANFTTLRYPIYLSNLTTLAKRGEIRALHGLRYMRDPLATRNILILCHNTNSKIAEEARKTLLQCIPDVTSDKNFKASSGNTLNNSDFSWSPKLVPDVMKLAWTLLESSNRETLIEGAIIIKEVGIPKDMPNFIKIFDRVLILMKDDPIEQSKFLRSINACDSLMDAGIELLKREAQPPTNTDSNASNLITLCAINEKYTYEASEWKTTSIKLLKNPIPFIRATALSKLPNKIEDDTILELVRKLISDPHPPVQNEALKVAEREKRNLFSNDALNVLQDTHNEWIISQAYNTAVACGIQRDKALEIVIGRLDDTTMTYTLLTRIIFNEIVGTSSGSGNDHVTQNSAIQLKTTWQTFLNAHREEIRIGKRFKVPNPPLTPEMFLPVHQFYLPNGKYWPETPAIK